MKGASTLSTSERIGIVCCSLGVTCWGNAGSEGIDSVEIKMTLQLRRIGEGTLINHTSAAPLFGQGSE